MTAKTTERKPSLLREILLIIYKNSSPKERKELDRYDEIEFVNIGNQKKK